ncbi:MAG: hypothetical protein KIT02_06755 [Devosia sp.]|uniref:hypothetical protein n=1 Tax=Devosia sp. TaxID=1871048 RepID=UPI0024CAB8C3|nr:hypothetical protein [Devosia sp.]UYO00896.1 MAG: hypothetical protein KIT02_06755 [Devosia sp.]
MSSIARAWIMFAPDRWGQIDKFHKFWSPTYEFASRDQRALTGVRAHFDKAIRLVRLAERLRPNLRRDIDQLNKNGFTPAEHARELATIIEAAILELYSSIDCTVKVLRAVYGPGTKGFQDSTRKTFQKPHRMQGTFPDELKAQLVGATWYGRLQRLRDDLTHLDTGHVHLDEGSDVVRYSHYGMKEGAAPLTIPNVFAWFFELFEQVNSFLGAIFHHLNATLKDEPVFQMCGMVDGRVLHRYVSPVGNLTFDSGSCGAWIWFERPENPSCPFKDQCGAYSRKAPPQGWETDATALDS